MVEELEELCLCVPKATGAMVTTTWKEVNGSHSTEDSGVLHFHCCFYHIYAVSSGYCGSYGRRSSLAVEHIWLLLLNQKPELLSVLEYSSSHQNLKWKEYQRQGGYHIKTVKEKSCTKEQRYKARI